MPEAEVYFRSRAKEKKPSPAAIREERRGPEGDPKNGYGKLEGLRPTAREEIIVASG